MSQVTWFLCFSSGHSFVLWHIFFICVPLFRWLDHNELTSIPHLGQAASKIVSLYLWVLLYLLLNYWTLKSVASWNSLLDICVKPVCICIWEVILPQYEFSNGCDFVTINYIHPPPLVPANMDLWPEQSALGSGHWLVLLAGYVLLLAAWRFSLCEVPTWLLPVVKLPVGTACTGISLEIYCPVWEGRVCACVCHKHELWCSSTVSFLYSWGKKLITLLRLQFRS